MDNSSLNATEIAVGSLLAGGNRGGVGGGAWGGGFGAPFADPGSNAVRINRNMAVSEANDRCTKEVTEMNINRLSDQAEESRRSAQSTAVMTAISDSEFRGIARDNATNARLEANNIASVERDHRAEIKALECCCKLEAEMKAIESRGIAREADNLRADLVALKTQIACGCCPPA